MTTSIDAWRNRIERHHAQSLKAQGDLPGYSDRWSAIVDNFRADPRRTDDPVVNALHPWLAPETTVIDVGGGAGRYALPLALHCRHVTVVDPSESMLKALEEGAEGAGIDNVSAVCADWEDAHIEPADIVLCANVVYGVAAIEPFVRKLSDHARDRVAVLVYMDAPMSMLSPLWKVVHGEERINLPALPELLPVLWEMGIYPNVEMLGAGPPRYAPSLDVALQFARHMLYVQPGSEKDDRLQRAVQTFAKETPEGVTLRNSGPRPQGLVCWRTDGGR